MEKDFDFSQVNDAIKQLELIEPMFAFFVPKNETTLEMKKSLAEAYSKKGFRDYLMAEYNRQIARLAYATSLADIAFIKGRALTLKEMLAKSRVLFTEYEKISRIPIKPNGIRT